MLFAAPVHSAKREEFSNHLAAEGYTVEEFEIGTLICTNTDQRDSVFEVYAARRISKVDNTPASAQENVNPGSLEVLLNIAGKSELFIVFQIKPALFGPTGWTPEILD